MGLEYLGSCNTALNADVTVAPVFERSGALCKYFEKDVNHL
jgi:hypothetical protein